MKLPIFKTLLFALVLSFVSFSCNNDDDVELAVGQIVAKIDGENFESTGATAEIIFTGFPAPVDTTQTFTMIGAKANGIINSKSITMFFALAKDDILNKTTYSYDDTVGNCDPENQICGAMEYATVDYFNPADSKFYESTFGNITITFTDIDYKKGGHVKGTFSGTLTDESDINTEISVTEGKFNLLINP